MGCGEDLLTEGGVRRWLAKWHLRTFQDLYPDGRFLELADLRGRDRCTPLDAFLYHRLRQTCCHAHPDFPQQPCSLPALDVVALLASPAKLITQLYSAVQTHFVCLSFCCFLLCAT